MKYPLVQCICLTIIVFLFVLSGSMAQESSKLTAAEARKIIADGNVRWGKARIAFDVDTFQEMLAPDFYVKIRDQELTRQQFIDSISRQRTDVKLTRFDATVLTVQQIDDEWVAVIHEKLEMKAGDDKVYSLWITRDGWKQTENGWTITFSEAIGWQQWRGVETPPFSDW